MSSADGWRIGLCRCCPGRGSTRRSGCGVRSRRPRTADARGSGGRGSSGSAARRRGSAARSGATAGASACAVLRARRAARPGRRSRRDRRRRGEHFACGLRALRGRIAERLGLGDHIAEALQALVGHRAASPCADAAGRGAARRGRARRDRRARGIGSAAVIRLRAGSGARHFAPAPRGFGLDLADRFFEREALARDLGFGQRRIVHPAQLRDQSRARALIERATAFAGVLFETGDGLGDERIIIGHSLATSLAHLSRRFRNGSSSFERVLHQYCVFPLRTGRQHCHRTVHQFLDSPHVFYRLRGQFAPMTLRRAVALFHPSTVS